jgi:hypothetical protein
MNFLRTILIITSLISASYGVVVTGTVIDSSSNSPLSGVSVVFRVGENPDAYPKAMTDSDGRFSSDMALEENFPLQIFFEKDAYLPKKITILITGNSIDLGTIALVKPAEFTAYFFGRVLDSVTNSGLAGVQIVILRKWGDSVPYLQYTTDSLGKFGLNVQVSGDMNGKAIWYIEKQGYYLANGTITANMDSIHQTILLQPEGSIRVQVTGTVIDSLTRAVIPNARVILFTTFLDVEKDTSLTDASGAFDRSIEAGKTSAAIPAVIYIISAPGYSTKAGMVEINQTMADLDLGKIALTMTTGIPRNFRSPQAGNSGKENHRIFLLNGRLHSTGGQKMSARNRSRAASQMVIINTGHTNRRLIPGAGLL